VKSLFAAYLAIWIIIFGYLLTLASRQKALARRLEELRNRIEGES